MADGSISYKRIKKARETLAGAARSGVSGKDLHLIFHKALEFETEAGVPIEVIFKALIFAAQDGNLQLVTLILDRAGSKCIEYCDFINGRSSIRGREVSSPLFVAVKAGHLEVVCKFISYLTSEGDVTVFLSDSRYERLVQWAVRSGHASIVKFLLDEFCKCNDRILGVMARAFALAALHGHLDVLKVILERNVNGIFEPLLFDDSRELRLTALHLAAQSGFVGAVELLVNTAKMDATEGSEPENFTPLHLAANFGHVEVVRFFLTEWARSSDLVSRIMARDCLGRTALHYAAREGHVQVVHALVNQNRDIALVQDDDGLLALHMAARAGHIEVIKALNSFGGIMHRAKYSQVVKDWVELEYKLEGGKSLDECSLTFYPGKNWRISRMKLFDSLFWRTEDFTPLHFAARYGYKAAVEELLKNKDAGSSALFMQDSGGFLAYDWMKVQGQGKAFVQSCSTALAGKECIRQEEKQATQQIISSGLDVDLNILTLELEKRSGLHSKVTDEISGRLAAHIREEKQAVEELQLARQTGDGNIQDVIYRMPVVQWLLEDEEDVDAPWPHGLSLSMVKPYFHALDRALQKENWKAAKHILLHYPSADLRLDAAGVSDRVKNLSRGMFSKESGLEDFLIVLVTREELALGASALRCLAQRAKVTKCTSLLKILMDRSEVKRGFYEDRQLYVDCANAMLVGAALIAGVAFQGWLQPPLGYSYEYQGSEYADVQESAVRAFWWFNNGSFFLAVASLIAGAKGAVPVRDSADVERSLEKVRRAVGVASSFLGMALVCVVGAFSAAGFAVLPPLASSGLQMMRICVRLGTSLCALSLIWFSLGILPLVTETIRYMCRSVEDLLLFCIFCILIIPYFLGRLYLPRFMTEWFWRIRLFPDFYHRFHIFQTLSHLMLNTSCKRAL